MKKITDLASPATMQGIYLCLLLQLVLFFRPSLFELFVFFCVDVLMLILAMRTDPFFFKLFFPTTKAFYPAIDDAYFLAANDQQKKDLFRWMAAYPRQRSLYMIPANLIKIIPSSLVIIFYWQHSFSSGLAFFYFFVMALFNICYMSAMVYLENHAFLSKEIKVIHARYDWRCVFADMNPQQQRSAFALHRLEVAAVLPIWLFVGALQAAILLSDTQSRATKVAESLCAATFACFFTMHIISASRKQILQGLQSVFESVAHSYDDKLPLIPCNTLPVVTHFQKTLNGLVGKLNAQEEEISSWIIERMEQRRFVELGELAGLVVHDLMTPLLSARHFASGLAEKEISLAEREELVERLQSNVDHAADLLRNLLTTIRRPNHKSHAACVFQAEAAVRKILTYRHMASDDVPAIKFIVEKPAKMIRVNIPQPELKQILMNLYSNSIKDLISHRVEQPTIKISLYDEGDDFCRFCIEDNGTGLSLKDFEFITENKDHKEMSSGIGLRLTRRLIEYHHGTLQVIAPEGKRRGTAFVLGLPKAAELGDVAQKGPA